VDVDRDGLLAGYLDPLFEGDKASLLDAQEAGPGADADGRLRSRHATIPSINGYHGPCRGAAHIDKADHRSELDHAVLGEGLILAR
jgi:hypothetical protein